MRKGKIPQYSLPFIGKLQQYLAAVHAVPTFNIASGSQPIDQLYGAMMLNLKTFCHFADARPYVFWQTFYGQHKLMLARLDVGCTSGSLAEVQKPPDLMP